MYFLKYIKSMHIKVSLLSKEFEQFGGTRDARHFKILRTSDLDFKGGKSLGLGSFRNSKLGTRWTGVTYVRETKSYLVSRISQSKLISVVFFLSPGFSSYSSGAIVLKLRGGIGIPRRACLTSLPGPNTRDSDSVGWGEASKSAFQRSSQQMQMMLVREPLLWILCCTQQTK